MRYAVASSTRRSKSDSNGRAIGKNLEELRNRKFVTSRTGFVLDVECDGKAYHSDWTARVRDVWRQRILEGRGWKIHRIWSTNW